MENDCPCCQRKVKVQPIAPLCEFCGYEFRPQPLTEQRTTTRPFAAVFYTVIGLSILAGAVRFGAPHASTLLRELLGAKPAPAAPAAAKTDTIHQILPTNAPAAHKGLIWGDVFDIRTLKPVAQATLVFRDPAAGIYFGAFTDREGHFLAWLPVRAEGYYVTVHHSEYRQEFTEDWIPSLRKTRAKARHELERDLIGRPVEEVHILPSRRKHKQHSFALVPRSE